MVHFRKKCFHSDEYLIISEENIGNKSVMYTLMCPRKENKPNRTLTH